MSLFLIIHASGESGIKVSAKGLALLVSSFSGVWRGASSAVSSCRDTNFIPESATALTKSAPVVHLEVRTATHELGRERKYSM